jgi:hypothetical protein
MAPKPARALARQHSPLLALAVRDTLTPPQGQVALVRSRNGAVQRKRQNVMAITATGGEPI